MIKYRNRRYVLDSSPLPYFIEWVDVTSSRRSRREIIREAKFRMRRAIKSLMLPGDRGVVFGARPASPPAHNYNNA